MRAENQCSCKRRTRWCLPRWVHWTANDSGIFLQCIINQTMSNVKFSKPLLTSTISFLYQGRLKTFCKISTNNQILPSTLPVSNTCPYELGRCVCTFSPKWKKITGKWKVWVVSDFEEKCKNVKASGFLHVVDLSAQI